MINPIVDICNTFNHISASLLFDYTVWYTPILLICKKRKHLSFVIEILFPATFFCFFSLVACSFKDKEKKPRNFSVCVALVLIQDAISTLSLFYLFFYWGACQMPSLSHHRAKCCEYFHPLPIRNFAGLSAVRLLCSPQPHRTLLQRHIASELCKLSSS